MLLPTRNGADFLPACLDSVLEQDIDLELVVSDNANQDGTAEILLERAADPRLVVVTHREVLSVTDNWASALDAATGRYLLMMGDDDLLLPGSAGRIIELLKQAGRPDCLTYNAFSFVFPGAMSDVPISHYSDVHFAFGPEFVPYQELSQNLRTQVVRDMFRFRPRIPLNMQTTVFSREATTRIRGSVFPPPFPDHYALNSLLLTAPRWSFAPERLVVIGVTPKSFGHFVYSDKQEAGLHYLGVGADFPDRVPGNALIDAMYMWLQMLLDAYPDLLKGTTISRGDYVLRQVWSWLVGRQSGAFSTGELLGFVRRVSAGDLREAGAALLRAPDLWAKGALRLRPGARRTEARWHGLRPLPEISDIAEFGRWVGARR